MLRTKDRIVDRMGDIGDTMSEIEMDTELFCRIYLARENAAPCDNIRLISLDPERCQELMDFREKSVGMNCSELVNRVIDESEFLFSENRNTEASIQKNQRNG